VADLADYPFRSGVGLGLGANLGADLSVDPSEARSLALLGALRGSQEAGLQRTASPMGSIAQNLIPIFGAMITAKALERQAAMQQAKQAMEMQKLGVETAKAKAELARAQRGPTLNLGQSEAGAIARGDQEMADKYGAAIRANQKPAGGSFGAYLAIARGDPAKALELQNAESDRRTQLHATIMAQQSSRLADTRAQIQQEKEDRKIVDEKGGVYVFDKNTGKRVENVPSGWLRRGSDEYNPNLLTLKGTDAAVWNKTKQVTQQLDQLEALVPKVLPTKEESYLGRFSTFLGIRAQQKLGTNAEITNFNLLGKFSKFPAIQELNSLRRLPKSETDTIPDFATDSDTQESALAKNGERAGASDCYGTDQAPAGNRLQAAGHGQGV
jgi:hypothetical protein